MKAVLSKLTFLSLLFLALSCGQKSHDHQHIEGAGDAIANSPNEALLNEVDKLHNELMMQMEDIYKQKEELKNKLSSTPNLADEVKQKIEASMAKLDSADRSMMDWMHNFKPPVDSLVGEEKAREYLENEMEKVKKLQEDINEALESAKVN
jgi:chromosome segregation ATPase